MNKGLLLKIFVLCLLFCQLVNKAQAQYAVAGTASTNLQKSIYWLTWSPGSFGMSTSSGGTSANIVNGTYVWQYSPTARITAVISNRTLTDATTMPGYTPGSFFGDGLDVLYNGNAATTKAVDDGLNQSGVGGPYSRGVPFSGIGTVNAQNSHPIVKFDISLKVELLINSTNTWTEVKYPGMVIADAESIGWITTPTSESEYFSGTTNGATGWRLLNLRLDGNIAKNDGYLMDLSNSGKDFKVYISGQTKADPGAQAVLYAHGATSLSNLTMKGNGRTSISIGFILPFDLGDAPNPSSGNSYGRPESYINDFTFVDNAIPDANGIILKNVFNTGGAGAGVVTITPKAKTYLGANNVDADGFPTGSVFPAGATTDNSTLNGQSNDEDGVTTSGINIKVNRGDLTVTVPSITNIDTDEFGTFLPANLYGWIDFNNDGKFDASEIANTVTIPANQTAISRDLVFPRSRFGATNSTIQFGSSTYMRLRISKNALTDFNGGTAFDDASITSTANGEIEDYKLNDLTGVVIQGNVYNDNNGATDNTISGTALSDLSGNPLYAYLATSPGGVVLQKVAVTGGAYAFTQVNNGTYIVAVSTTSISVSSNISTLGLVSGWAASVDSYGTNNSVGSGIESGVPNLQVTVTPTIGGNGGDVENVNFGINQAPVANPNLGIAAKTNTDTAPVDLSTGDNDPDGGTVISTTVEIENPNGTPAYITTGSFTVTGQGTYTINPTTRNVVFQSEGTHTGPTTPINYRVKDNFGTYSNVSTFSYTVTIGGAADAYETTMGTPVVNYAVRGNDGTAANTGTVTVTPTATSTQGGTVTGTDLLTYTPQATFVGIDTYTYTLTKNAVTSSDITVTVTVKPKGSDDSDETTQGIAKATTVLTNDLTNTGVTITPGSNPANGTLSLTGSGTTITYTPTGTFVGSETYTYTLTKNGQTSAAITVTMVVKPKGSDDSDATAQGIAKATTVLTNDLTNTGVTITPGSNPANGTLSLTGGGTTITYTPTGTFIGSETYTYTLTKNGQTSAAITVTMVVKPKGSDDSDETTQGIAKATTVLTNDLTNTGVTITPGSNPANGTLSLTGSGTTITYTPTGTFVGSETYTYTITKNGQTSAAITVTMVVKPKGSDDSDATAQGIAKATTVLTNDLTNTGVTITPGSNPANGTLSLTGSGTTITYTPTGTFVGSETYTYTLTKNGQTSTPITVTIAVKPKGTDDTDVTTLGIAKATTVLTNDLTNTGVTITPGANPANGTLILTGGGTTITYTPTGNFIGIDTYTYTLTKGGQTSAPITVTITVKPKGVNDVASTDVNIPVPTIVTDNDGPSGVTPVTVTAGTGPTNGSIVVSGTTITYTPNTNYVGSDSYTYTLTKNGLVSDPITVFVNVGMTGSPDADITTINTPVVTVVTTNDGASGIGSTVTAGNGSNGTTAVNGSTVTYTPTSSFIGVDTYTYTLTKNGQTSAPITVTITVKPKGVNDVASTTINTPVPTVVTTNDGPSGVTPVTVTAGTPPVNGAISVSGTTITYTPNTGYVGNDSYTYTLTKNGLVSDPITVSVSVTNLPTGSPDTDITPINTPVTTNVIGNDADGTGSTVTAGNGSNGTTGVTGGTVTYTPNADFIGVDTYTYTLTKNSVSSAPITVTITVKPKGVNDVASTTINTPVPTVVTTNDGPSGVSPVTVTAGTAPINGSIAVSGTTITYTPNTGYVGNDSYTYTLTKNSILSDPITVSVTVKPVGVDDSDLTPVNTPVITTVTTNDGASGTGATVSPTAGSHGTTTVSGGNVTYTPANGYIGTDTYTYTLTKNSVTSAPITVTINVYSATMSLSKVANNGATKAGDVINYTLIVKNTGNVTLSNIVITDAGADPNSILPSPNIVSLAPGASATVTANHTVTTTNVTAGQFANQATATGKDPKDNPVTKISDDPGTTTPDDPTVVPIIPVAPASINLAKTGVFSGNQVSYTFIITNNGGVPLNTITLTDTKLGLSGITITAPTGGLLPNQSLTYNATYILTQADKDLGAVNNTATVSAKDPGNNTVTGAGSTVTTVPTSPVATNDAAETDADTPEIISVLINDDAKGSTFDLTSIEIVSSPMHGTVVKNANGTITYTPTAGYTGTDSFTYRVKDAFGYYTNVATVTITTNLVVELKIPTLFSPNGDGVNDEFIIKDLGDYAQNELTVVNRWGNEVYKQADYKNSWSGTGLNEGTYFYIVRLKKSNGESWVIRKGYVTLIRTFKK